jgi:hypothetical protein
LSITEVKSAAAALTLCAMLSGCAVQLYGNQATSGGTTATTTSSAVVASGSASNVRAGFSFGQPVAASAPGGQLGVNGAGAVAAVVLVSAVVVEFLYSLGGGQPPVKPLAPEVRISHTCSCYGWKPPAGEKEVMKGGDEK